MSIRLPLDLAQALEKAAKGDDLTMAQYIRRALRRDLAREDDCGPPRPLRKARP